MNITAKQISSLIKARTDIGTAPSVSKKMLLKGQSFNYQIAFQSDCDCEFSVSLSSPLAESITLYAVKNVIMDYPAHGDSDDDYITKESGVMPDLLVPLSDEANAVRSSHSVGSVWVRVKIPEDCNAGKYSVKITLSSTNLPEPLCFENELEIEVINAVLPVQKTKFTEWFHVDCIADIHSVPVYSEAHWELIDKYMRLATETGINMLLTPVITPPLDTEVGLTRPCTQLVSIEKTGESYKFDFSKLSRWVSLCNKNGIKYFEISHFFSQWGLKYSPNILVSENGKESYLFGWSVLASSPEYRDFLTQFIPALIDFLKENGILERCYFHVSDEPSEEHVEAYKYAHGLLKSLIGDCPTLDALSRYEFYEKGLVSTPVTATNHIEEFLPHKVENQWIYYCCGQGIGVGNRFLAMPSYRNRILGLQMYKYGIKGFLQWGFNFYYSQLSRKIINPYITSSADKAFPSGDAFSVYPGINKPLPSLRVWIFKEALEDIELCRTLEGFIGREGVIKMIDTAAEMNLTFADYPRNYSFIPAIIEQITEKIKEFTDK